ncbi:MAG TPA: hypothetical protein VEL76_10560, partial [Gemmataceae bacterium]|nr:hypothetical protein [Gemmataceae bacterium]
RNPAGVSVAFAHDSRRLVSVGQDGRMRFWETDTGQELLTLTPTQPNTRSPGVQVGFNPNRRQVATAFENGNIEIRDWAPEERPAGNP